MKNGKILWLLVSLCVLTFVFTSCKKGNKTEKPAPVDDCVIYSPYVETTIVIGDDVDEDYIRTLKAAYYNCTGKQIAVSNGSSQSEHEILIGKTDRALSEKANRMAERIGGDGDSAYTIYSDGKSVAIGTDGISFGENVALAEAIDRFVQDYMKNDSLKLDSGAVFYDFFDPIEKQKERDEISIEKTWEYKLTQISAKLDDNPEKAAEIVANLKSLRNIFNKDHSIVLWLANLYDPVTGGFYYSNSARNFETYGPDLKSTAEALGLIETILVGYEGTLVDYFGEEIASDFVSFAKSMQDEGGYFYHPQWPKETLDKNQTRLDNDLLNALNILETFGASPAYTTPNGVTGDGIITPISNFTLQLRRSNIKAVSSIAGNNEDEIYIPPYLESNSTFNEYLKNLNILNNTESFYKTVSSEISTYVAVDESLEENGEKAWVCDALYNYLMRYQSDYTGLWSVNKVATYSDLEASINVIKLFNGIGKAVSKPDIIINTLIKTLRFSEEAVKITDISITWSAFAAIANNLNAFSEVNDYLYVYDVIEDINNAIEVTRKELSNFTNNDGSFSSTIDGSAYMSFDMPVAVPYTKEGDMNATLLAVKNIWIAMFNVLDIGSVPIFNTSDRMMFQKTLLDMGVIIKNEVKKTPPVDFELETVGDSYFMTIDGSGQSSGTIVSDPTREGNALKLYAPDSRGKIFDRFHFDIASNANNGTCFAYEMDLCVLPESSEGVFAQLVITNQVIQIVQLIRKGDTVRLAESSDNGDVDGYIYDLGVSAKVGEWFTIRVEYYYGNESTVRTKIYFKNEGDAVSRCVTVSDIYFAKHYGKYLPLDTYKGVAVRAYYNRTTEMLVDNVVVETNYKTYTPETSDINRNIDAPDDDQKIHDFENILIGKTPDNFTATNPDSVKVIGDSSSDNQLSISESAGKVTLPLDQRGSYANSVFVQFDLTVPKESATGSAYRVNFNEYYRAGTNFGAMQFIVVEEDGEKYLKIAEVSSGKVTAPYDSVKINLGEEHIIGLQLFFNECVIVVSVDEEIVGINGNVTSSCSRLYVGEITIESVTPDKSSKFLIDNLVVERVRNDYEEATAASKDRELYTFDSADGMELHGISPDDGVLSFDNVTEANPYVQIPLNSRVSVPTVALVGFDVLVSGNGSIVVAFNDNSKNPNTIAAFEIVAQSNKIEIYEYTKAGRYSSPIHTFDSAEFNFSIEYSEKKESFNLLIDGKYVAASSLNYNLECSSFDFKNLRIYSGLTSSEIAIDNLYAEEIIGIFKAQEVSMPNVDGTEAVITYETSSFASMPKNMERILGSTASHHLIRASKVYDNVSKVLEVYCGPGGATMCRFPKTEDIAASNAVFFETDIMLKETNGNFSIYLEIFSDKVGEAYTFILRTNGVGEYIKASGGYDKDYSGTLNVKEGEWFKVRIEYRDTPHDFDYDGKTDLIARVYINGKLLYEGHSSSAKEVQPTSVIHTVRTRNPANDEGLVYYDNTRLCNFNMYYETPIEPDTDTLTFNPGVITYQTEFKFGKNTSSAKITDMTDIFGAVSKVLNLYSSNGSSDKMNIVVTKTAAPEENANAIVFETDIMIVPKSETSVFYLEPTNAKGKNQPFRLTLTANKGGNVTLTNPQNSAEEIIIGKSGEWIHLKVEYMNPMLDYTGDRKADILYKIYSSGAEKVVVGYQPYESTSYSDPLTLTKFAFTVSENSVAEVNFDNIKFWQVPLIPDTPEVFDDEEDFSHGGAGTDLGGWTNK